MRNFLLLLFLINLFAINNLVAQGLKRSSLNSFGGVVSNGNIKLSQSAGQSSAVQTTIASKVQLRQGFQQPFNNSIFENNKLNISIYPNPTKSELTVSFDGIRDNEFSYYLFDSQGRICQFEKNSKSKNIQLNKSLNAGVYTMRVLVENRVGVASIIIIP